MVDRDTNWQLTLTNGKDKSGKGKGGQEGMELKWTRDEMRMNSGMKWEIDNWNEMGNWQLE